MLNTFENASRQHHRREERERHIRRMEAFAKSLEFDDLSACAMADALSGNELEKMQEESILVLKNGKKRTAIVVICALIILILTCFFLGVDTRQMETAQQSVTTTSQNTRVDPILGRTKKLFSLILDWGITSRPRLEDPTSPAARALDWLVYTDVKTTEVEAIRTRYALACLFFATQSPEEGYTWIEDRHWLSSFPVCLWHGVECIDQRDTIAMVKSLNLSANALIGTIPDEIGMIGLDIHSLDVSDNKIVGSIPKTLFILKNLGTWNHLLPPSVLSMHSYNASICHS